MREEMSEEIVKMIKESIKNIDEKYFNLPVANQSSGIVRERVFCSELYQQIRKYQENLKNLNDPIISIIKKATLNGEPDKKGHPEYERKDQKNPDFILHTPGDMEGNIAVIEVKGKLKYKKDIINDFNKLTLFVKKYKYQFGIFILYNHSKDELKNILKQNQREIENDDEFNKIDIISAVNNKLIDKTTLSDILKN